MKLVLTESVSVRDIKIYEMFECVCAHIMLPNLKKKRKNYFIYNLGPHVALEPQVG